MSFDPVPWVTEQKDPDKFDAEVLYGRLPSIVRRQGPRKSVCVIGGGIAGLAAAYELKRLGHNVTLLEADERCGGRILTHHFPYVGGGQYYGELGAMRFPMGHNCTVSYAREFLLNMVPFVQDNEKAYYHLRGQRFRQGPWNPGNPPTRKLYPDVRPPNYRAKPATVLDGYIKNGFDLLQALEKWDVFNPALADPRVRKFEQYSTWQQIKGMLLRSDQPYLHGSLLNDEEWEYIGRATGDMWREKLSYLEALVLVETHRTSMVTIDGGMGKMVEALEQRLTEEIQRNSPVTNIDCDSTGVRVRWSCGDQSRDARFQYVVCAVPAGAVAGIQFAPSLSAKKYEALTNVSYQSAAKSLVLCNARRWEWQDGIYGGGSHTDMENQECWYPPDNAQPIPDEELPDDTQADVGPDGKRLHSHWRAKDPKVSRRPGVLIAAYMTGTNARRFASLTNDERDTMVVTRLNKLHPGIEDDICAIEHHSWDAQANPGGGAWAAFMPGERERYQEAMVAPYPSGEADGSRVFFAGEHLGITHGWIQPAIQTAHGAVWWVNLGSP